jgi:hypothetical protein
MNKKGKIILTVFAVLVVTMIAAFSAKSILAQNTVNTVTDTAPVKATSGCSAGGCTASSCGCASGECGCAANGGTCGCGGNCAAGSSCGCGK